MGIVQSSSSTANPESRSMALAKAKEIVASSTVVVFSKSYCPFCTQVKELLAKLGASFKTIELDVESDTSTSKPPDSLTLTCDGAELQSALAEWTGQRTVPNVFINEKHIGGCDATMAMNNEGKLVPLLTEAGAIASPAA